MRLRAKQLKVVFSQPALFELQDLDCLQCKHIQTLVCVISAACSLFSLLPLQTLTFTLTIKVKEHRTFVEVKSFSSELEAARYSKTHVIIKTLSLVVDPPKASSISSIEDFS